MLSHRVVSPVRSTPVDVREMESPSSIDHPVAPYGATALPSNQVVADGLQQNENGDVKPLLSLQQVRTGDVISPHRAVLTLAKSMFNAGCFSLPFAWKLGGLWMSFGLSFVIAGFNWYGNHILAASSQHLAKLTNRTALDYGHFTKKVLDASDIPYLRRNSKGFMYVVNVTILFYQLGMCSVSVLFISDNLMKILLDLTGHQVSMVVCATIAIVFILATNMYTEMRIISFFAMVSTIFFLFGAVVIMQYAIRQPTQWDKVPAATNFKDTVMFIGMAMYAFEGQTMILPIENKLRTPHDFLNNCGVLPTTMMLCSLFMCALGFYGYTAFGDGIKQTITLNMPNEGLYTTVNVFLMIQSMLGHSIAMYVVFDMFFNGFRRKFLMRFPNTSKFVVDKGFRTFWVFITYLMAIMIPKLDIMIPLVGVTSGTLCALVYPPILEMITFWTDWQMNMAPWRRRLKITLNCCVVVIGVAAITAGLYANIDAIIVAFSTDPYGPPK